MKNCGNCSPETNVTKAPKSELEISLQEIATLIAEDEEAFDFASSHKVYEQLRKGSGDFFVSEEHAQDEVSGNTFYVVATNQAAHDEFTKGVERQHTFQGTYEELR